MSEENSDSNTDLMATFMQNKMEEQGDKKTNEPKPKKKNALEEARDKEEEEEKKELEKAKKNSLYNTSKYKEAQLGLMMAKGRSALMAIPFIVLTLVLLLVVINNGGRWVQNGTQFLIRKIRGG